MHNENPETKAENIRRMFDSISHRYDFLNSFLSLRRDRSWRRRAVRLLNLSDSDVLLDLACGTGDVALTALKKTGGPGEIIGIDFSSNMLVLAREKFAEKKVAIPYTFIEGDARELPLADASVDAVTIAFGIRNVVDVPKALREMRRVLRPGGRVVILEFAVPRGRVFGPLFQWYFLKVLPVIGGIISGNKKAYEYLPASVGTFYTREQLTLLMQEAGFIVQAVKAYTFGVTLAYLGSIGDLKKVEEL